MEKTTEEAVPVREETLPAEPENRQETDAPGEMLPSEREAWEAFMREYPLVTAENIPEEVLRRVSEGEAPLGAMRAYENRQLKQELAALRQSLARYETGEENRKKSTGTARGTGAAEPDAFLSGLYA